MAANIVSLNDDVLINIISHLDPADARQLSRTARALHPIASDRVLQSAIISSLGKVIKFCKYMLNEKRDRLFALRELRIHCLVLPAVTDASGKAITGRANCLRVEGATLLADLFYKSTGLRTLALHSAEHWMQHEPRLVDVLSRMRQLTEIELRVLGQNSSKFLNEMQSAPRKLVLRAPPQQVCRAPAQRPFGARLNLDPLLQLPSVEYLAALDNNNLPGLADLARLFPSTRSLDTSLESSRPARGQPLPVIDWPTLEYVRGPAGSFANWRNVTSIHLLELVDQLHFQGPRKVRTVVDPKAAAVLAAVDNVQPVALIARLDSKLPASFWMELIKQWNRGSARLRYFAVELSDINSYRTCGAQLARWWANVGAAVKSSGIICLEVRCPLQRDVQLGASGTSASKTMTSFKDTIFHTFPASVRDAAFMLRYLCLDMSLEIVLET